MSERYCWILCYCVCGVSRTMFLPCSYSAQEINCSDNFCLILFLCSELWILCDCSKKMILKQFCDCVCVYLCVSVNVCVGVGARTLLCVYLFVHMCLCVCVFCVHILCMYMCVCTWAYICTYVNMCALYAVCAWTWLMMCVKCSTQFWSQSASRRICAWPWNPSSPTPRLMSPVIWKKSR